MNGEPGRDERVPPRFARGTAEFARVINFSDAIFAIAMTLLVIGIAVPKLSDGDSPRQLADALNLLSDSIASFFISFAVIGRYWVAHHQFVALLRGADRGLIGINLTYLALIAFLPFPTALMGNYFDNPLSVGMYAISIALVSTLEVVMFRHAYEHDLFERHIPPAVYRWGLLTSLSPVAFFLVSVPVAFLSTTAALLCWLAVIPFQVFTSRRKPAGTAEFLGG